MYKTGFFKTKTQILQTILTQLPKKNKKIILTIRFDNQEKQKRFLELEAQRRDDQEEEYGRLESDDDSESEDQKQAIDQNKAANQQTNPKDNPITSSKTPVPNKQPKQISQLIPIKLQQSIIFKQHYQPQLVKIGLKYNVKVQIRAQNIALYGFDIDDIQDTIQQLMNFIKQIDVKYINKYGLEIYQSSLIRRQFEQVGVKVTRILDKFYLWWDVSSCGGDKEKQKQKRKKINNLWNQVDKQIHCLQYLYNIDQNIDRVAGAIKNEYLKTRQKFMNYKPLMQELKGIIFTKQLSHIINQNQDQDDKDFVELSEDKDALIFHSDAKEYMQRIIMKVRDQYRNFQYFFLKIDYEEDQIRNAIEFLQTYQYDVEKDRQKSRIIPGKIEQIKQKNYIHFTSNLEKIKNKIQEQSNSYNGLSNKPNHVIICVGFRRKTPQTRLQYLCTILTKLQQLCLGLTITLSLPLQKQQQLTAQSHKLNIQHDHLQKVCHLRSNQNKYQQIIQQYIIKNSQSLKKQHDLLNTTAELLNNTEITGVTQHIQDSTYLEQKSISQELNSSNLLEKIRNQQFENQLLSNLKEKDQQAVKMLQAYNVFIQETNKEYNQKYKQDDVQMNSIVKMDKRNRTLEDQLLKITGLYYQVYKVQLNVKHKVDNFYGDVSGNGIVTVFLPMRVSPFMKQKSTGLKMEQNMNQTFSVKLLTNTKQLNDNGYLINIKKSNISIEGKSFRVKYGSEFQVAKQIYILNK